jgi:uncharacterized sulfatase
MQYKPPTGYLIRQSVNRYAALCLITIGLFLLVRLIEILYISGKAGYPPGSTFLMLYGMRYDLMLALRFSALLMLPFIVIDNLSKVTARVLFILSALTVMLADLMLLQYFAIHKIPLGSEILNYSFPEIVLAVKSSGELNFVNLLALGLFVLISLLAFLKWSALELSRDLTVVVIVLILFSVLPFNSTNPDRIDFRNDLRRNITANKVNALAAELVTHYLK